MKTITAVFLTAFAALIFAACGAPPANTEAAVLTYEGTYDGTCNDGAGGKSTKIPSPMRAATVLVRNGDKWQAAWHSETAIIEPKKDEKAADKTAVSDATKPDAKAEPKKEEPKAEVKKEEPKKDEAKKEEPKKDDKAAASDT